MFSRSAIARTALLRATRTFATSTETKINDILQRELSPAKLVVKDISGGCGSMFDIAVESTAFKGKSLVAQHKMVTQMLKAEIKEMHGLTLKTKAV